MSPAAQSTGHTIPHEYRATGDVTATRTYYRDRLGRFAANPTARAIQYVIANWHFCLCRDVAAGSA